MATGSSSEPNPGSPAFFKVVRNPSAPHLSLPIAFVRSYLNEIPKHPTLKTATGDHSWRVKIQKIDEDYRFTHGWEKLAQDVELRIRDILVFWLIDSCTFQVSFFDEHGCEKDLPLSNTSDTDEDDGEHDGDDGVMTDEDVYFQKVISEKNHKSYLVLPKKFVDDAGIEKKSCIKIKDKEGKEWEIGLRHETYRNTRLYLAAGWPVFRRHHDLCDGDMCLFRYIKKEGVLILAEMIRSKRPGLKRKIGGSGGGGGGGGVKVKDEDESGPEVELLKRKRPVEIQYGGGGGGGGGVEVKPVKVEDESCPEAGVGENKRGGPPLEKPNGGGGGGGLVKVKVEDEACPAEVDVVERNRGGPLVVKPCGGGGGSGGGGGGGELRRELEPERVVRHRQVIYF